MMIATRLLDRNQATLGKLFRQYAEAGERTPSSMDELVGDVEAASEGKVLSFRGRIEEYESTKRFLAELDRLAPNDEQYAAEAKAFAADVGRTAEYKK